MSNPIGEGMKERVNQELTDKNINQSPGGKLSSIEDLEQLLRNGSAEFGLAVEDKQISRFMKYAELLKEWNQKINLTAIEEDKDIILKHFVDSLSILPHIKPGKTTLVDVGTGAGFPGIPVKIVRDDVEVTLLDSLDKRVNFLKEVAQTLELTGIRAVHGRAEDFGVHREYRERFDIATARAVANLPVLLEYCLPFVKVGGVFLAMKGSSLEEVGASRKALEVLGGKIEEIREFALPFTDMQRNVVVVRKFRQTPTNYPRKAGKPSKQPLT